MARVRKLGHRCGKADPISDLNSLTVDLQAELRRKSAILESSVDVAIIATGPDGRISDWNAGAWIDAGS